MINCIDHRVTLAACAPPLHGRPPGDARGLLIGPRTEARATGAGGAPPRPGDEAVPRRDHRGARGEPRRAARRVRLAGRALGVRQVDPAAARSPASGAAAAAGTDVRRGESATSSRTPTLLPWRTRAATTWSCRRSCGAFAEAAPAAGRGDSPGRPRRVRRAPPGAAVRRDADARLARARAHPRAQAVPLRRAVRRPRRDRPASGSTTNSRGSSGRAASRGCSSPTRSRGGFPLQPGDGDVGRPGRIVATSRSLRLSAPARAAVRPGLRRACAQVSEALGERPMTATELDVVGETERSSPSPTRWVLLRWWCPSLSAPPARRPLAPVACSPPSARRSSRFRR